MNTQRIVLLVLLVMQSLAQASVSLKESYESALKTNFNERIDQAVIEQTMEVKNQGVGAYIPKLSVKGSYLKQEKIDDQKAIGLNLSHTLFKGGRDYFAVESADKSILVAKNQKTLDQITLYSNVVSAYYNYYQVLNDYQNIELLKKLSSDRMDELKMRVKVGRSRKGELLQAEAQLASADAQLVNAMGLLRDGHEKFYILTGLERTHNALAEPLTIDQKSVHPIEHYLELTMTRPDVVNKELKVEIAEIDLKSTKALHSPTVDIGSNYYFNKRTSTYKNTDWDASITMTLPLFEGGSTVAKVNESVSKKTQAIYNLSDYKRTLQLEIASRYETFHRYYDQIKALDLALEKAKKSYDVTLNDYRLGLVTNLDVLSSLNIYLDSKRNSEKNKISTAMSLKLLEASAGVLP